MLPVEKIGYGILLLGLIILAILPINNTNTTEEVLRYRVDSISTNLRYDVMPEKVYRYYTKFGVISGPKDKYKVGDSVEVRIIKIRPHEK